MSTLNVNNIAERTADSGVTIEGVLFKDSQINSSDIFTRRNYVINGNFDIWQRGTSFSFAGGAYTADRWRSAAAGGNIATDRTAFTLGQTDVPNNPEYYADVEVTGSVTDQASIEQRIEGVQTLAGDTVTLSFWAKYTTNQPSTSHFKARFVQFFGSGGSSSVASTSDAITLTTSWQKFTYTTTLPSVSGKTLGTNPYLIVRFGTSDAQTNYDFQIAQVQVEKGSVATDFEVRHIGEELSLCQRYFYKTFPFGTTPAQNVSPGRTIILNWTGAASAANSQNFAQTMRVAPTVTFYNPYAANALFRQWNSSNDKTYTAVEIQEDMIRSFYFNGDNFTGGHQNYTADAEL